MNKIILSILSILLFISISSANAGLWGESVDFADLNLNDQRTFDLNTLYNPPGSTGGLKGYWPCFNIFWNVEYDFTTKLWTYEYTLSTIKKDVSHFILELTEGTTKHDLTNLSINGHQVTFDHKIEGPKYWGEHPGNPGYPTSTEIYGIKFDVGDKTVTYSFGTANDPVWGNFYAKGGKGIYAFNSALDDDFNSENKLDFIVRPGGGKTPPIVPEPISSVLFIVGGATITIRHYWRNRKGKKHS